MTDSVPPTTTENRCYRHPDRETFVKCQRCGRPICGQCQTIAPVGVHCPECVREARGSAPSSRSIGTRFARAVSPTSQRPVVTYAIIALCVIVFLLELLTGDNFISGTGNSAVGNALFYYPGDITDRPWTIITSLFVHANILHIGLNMYSLLILGPPLERFLGRGRYIALYLLAGVGGDVAVDFFSKVGVLGASGAIFGLLGALIIFSRRLGFNIQQLVIVAVINLAAGFVLPGIAWQAHVGGLVLGVGIAFVYLYTRNSRRRFAQVLALVAIGVVMLLALLAHVLL
jgi:membrane associated rhomboid family serine protease